MSRSKKNSDLDKIKVRSRETRFDLFPFIIPCTVKNFPAEIVPIDILVYFSLFRTGSEKTSFSRFP